MNIKFGKSGKRQFFAPEIDENNATFVHIREQRHRVKVPATFTPSQFDEIKKNQDLPSKDRFDYSGIVELRDGALFIKTLEGFKAGGSVYLGSEKISN